LSKAEFVEASEPLLNLLVQQKADGLLDSEGRFRIDLSVLKDHYSSRFEHDYQAIVCCVQSAQRWDATGVEIRLGMSELKMNIDLAADSFVLERLGEDPKFRLSALFPQTHYLYEFATGYNVLAHSELSRRVEIAVSDQRVTVIWEFIPSSELRSSIWDLLRDLCTTYPMSLSHECTEEFL
jgi:hypothetical protein